MERQEIKRRVKSLKEVLDKMEDAIPDDATNEDVMDAACIILSNLYIDASESGMDLKTFIKFVRKKISYAILAHELKQS